MDGPNQPERNVLIVDDEKDFVIGLCDILESRGYLTESAHDLQTALTKILEFDAHVVLLDIRLGQDSGLDLLQQLKAINPKLICIMMTAYTELESVLGALKQGASDYLLKPLSPPDLLRTLEHSFEVIELEKDNEKLTNQLHQSQKMEAIGTMAGGIAHDFNNMLTIIQGFVDMSIWRIASKEKNLEVLIKGDLNQVQEATSRAIELVRQLLVFSRHEKPMLQPVNPSTITLNSLALLRSIIPTSVEFTQNIDSESGSILADPTQLNQILLNLCTNASQAMDDKGKLTVSLSPIELTESDVGHLFDRQPGIYVRLTVTDTGPGMPNNVMEKIFDPFFTTKASGKGTGLGLAVVHGIIENFGGIITVTSEPGIGSTFHVDIPQINTTQVEITEPTEQRGYGEERILVLDDEESIVLLLQEQLEQLGYQVTPCHSAAHALALFKQNPEDFDLLLTDQNMPEFTGIELAEKFQEIRPGMPIILCTGYSSKASKKRLTEAGISHSCTKPVSIELLTKLIRSTLKQYS